MSNRVFAFLAVIALVSCGGPTLLLPGGSLEGEVKPVPADWAFVEEVSTVQLESNPADPYSVNIWIVGIDGDLYVHAGANRAQWVENMEVDPNVRVRIEESIYELSATRVEDQPTFDVFADAYENKYGTRPRHEEIAEVYLYRLGSR